MNTTTQDTTTQDTAPAKRPSAKQARGDAPRKRVAKQAPAWAKRRATARPAAKDGGNTAKAGSKKALVLELLRREDGATLAEVIAVTGWQAHTVRGFMSGALIKKAGLPVESLRNDEGVRCYRLTA